MTDPNLIIAVAGSALAGLSLAAFAGLKGWQGWLDLKRLELTSGGLPGPAPLSPTSRIELADLRERVRKLEQIAAGVDL